jgi:hypothetical protein
VHSGVTMPVLGCQQDLRMDPVPSVVFDSSAEAVET